MTILIKLGGSAITDKEEEYFLKEEVLQRISNEISKIQDRILLVHGGGSFGHVAALEQGLDEKESEELDPLGFSRVHQAMNELNVEVVNSLISSEVRAVPVQTSACFMKESKGVRLENEKIIEGLLESGFCPVFYGDFVLDESGNLTILSGDQIIEHLAEIFSADRVIMGTDVDGVFTKDPKVDKEAELIHEISPKKWEKISSQIEFSSREDVTGGMENKIKVLIELAKKGIESRIINIQRPENLIEAVKSDKRVGTKISEG